MSHHEKLGLLDRFRRVFSSTPSEPALTSSVAIRKEYNPEQIDVFLADWEKKLEDTTAGKWPVMALKVADDAAEFLGMTNVAKRTVYEKIRANHYLVLEQQTDEDRTRHLLIGMNAALVYGVVSLIFNKEYPDFEYTFTNKYTRQVSWVDLFTKVEDVLRDNPLMEEIHSEKQQPVVTRGQYKAPAGRAETVPAFERVNLEAVYDLDLKKAWKEFQTLAQKKLGFTIPEESAKKLIADALKLSQDPGDKRWLGDLYGICCAYDFISVIQKPDGTETLKDITSLNTLFILAYVNEMKPGSGFSKIKPGELLALVGGSCFLLGEHPYAAALEKKARESELLRPEDVLRKLDISSAKEYVPGLETLETSESWDFKKILGVLTSLGGVPKPYEIEGIECFETIVPSEVAELATYIFTTLRREDNNIFRNTFTNLNVRGAKEILKFCAALLNPETHKSKNLRELYEKTERYKKSPHY